MFEKAENEILVLRKVLPSDLEAVRNYRQEFLEKGGSMDGASNLRRFENMDDWYNWIRNAERWESCPANWVPDIQFISLRKSDGRLVGMLDIRTAMNENIERLFGNIGYSIRHSERGKGYAIIQLGLAKEICRSMGMSKLLISCYRDNPASAKAILRNGGVLENEIIDERNGSITQRYWITL